MLILLEGHVRGEMVGSNDKHIVISELHAPNTLAEGFLFADKNKLLINVIARSKVKLMIISKNELLKLLSQNPTILSNYLNTISNRFVIVTEKLRFLMFSTVKEKLARYLLAKDKECGGKGSFKLGRTHDELATLFAITRPALTRNLLKLKRMD